MNRPTPPQPRDPNPSPAPGWYPNPNNPSEQLYWDGRQWQQPAQPQQPQPPQQYPGTQAAPGGYPAQTAPGYPGQQAPEQPKKGRSGCIIAAVVVGVIVLLGIIGVVIAVFVVGSAVDEAIDAGTSGAADPGAGLDESVRDGMFEFTVESFECGETTVEDPTTGVTEQAQGQFCVAEMTVENIGDEVRGFADFNQELVDADGREYEASPVASYYLTEGGRTVFENVNPGNNIAVRVAWDVPEDIEPAQLILHDSPFSNGVIVTL